MHVRREVRRFAVLVFARSRDGIRALGRGFWIAAGALAAIAAVVGALGGFAPAHRDPAPLVQLRAGETHDSAQVSVTILEAWVTDDPDLYLDEGVEAVVVELELTSRWTRPQPAYGVIDDVLAFSPVPEDGPDRENRADDGTPLGYLQPGVRTPVRLQWKVPAGSIAPGSRLHVTISDGAVRQFAVLGDDWAWGGHKPVAELDVPVEDRTGMAP